ncbi:thymidine phosphorylase [Ureaplasma miroungigenitalium]|uniref:thymidine phosphorylase n=1 Tax=Ureaplasma miroungigenitalium TaxID=1042321 RepID=UPI0021E76DD8|nr:thymidine phosphorylase [Ureaplasma miroungigenitalium]MCV3734435.1 thymidine phosphorylase [Ureaplasma miroungigenitalium]
MTFNILDLINKKQQNQALTYDEIHWLYHRFAQGEIPDYQMAAFLMAVYFNKYNDDEMYYATKIMVESGKTIDLRVPNEIVVDKHSSGGVGDKVSLIMTPMLVALGYYVGKMSGRGLAHTGGTVDKLESIGMNVDFDLATYQDQYKANKFILTGQSNDVAVIDKYIYALRDATSTVHILELAAASIMSKKFALLTDYIFLDIKTGDGSITNSFEEAKVLAKKCLYLAKRFNRETIVHITNMNRVLGRSVGNAIEVREAMRYLQGDFASKDLYELINTFLIDILVETKKAQSVASAQAMIDEVIANKKAFHIFVDWVKWMHGDHAAVLNETLFKPKYEVIVQATANGYIGFQSTREIGLVAVDLKAGRKEKNEQLDWQAGIYLDKKDNEYVQAGDVIAHLYADAPIDEAIVQRFVANVVYLAKPSKEEPAILDILRVEDVCSN